MNKQPLKNIAHIISGYSFRTALERGEGSIFVLQAKNILLNSTIEEDALDSIVFDKYRSQAEIKKSDVIISSRGHFRAGVVNLGIKNIIAASSVYIIRLYQKNILPEYLAIFLNSSKGQQRIKEMAAGAVIPAILRKDIENIYIPIPNLETQEKIVKMYNTNQKLKDKLGKKIELIGDISNKAIYKLLTN